MKSNAILIFPLSFYDQPELFFTSFPPTLLSLPLIFPSPLSLFTRQ